jgi:hypothetical protein
VGEVLLPHRRRGRIVFAQRISPATCPLSSDSFASILEADLQAAARDPRCGDPTPSEASDGPDSDNARRRSRAAEGLIRRLERGSEWESIKTLLEVD